MQLELTPEDLRALFRTIAQTYGAILALYGMLTVYRLERLNKISQECWKRADNHLQSLLGIEDGSSVSADDLVSKWNGLPDKRKDEFRLSHAERTRISFNKVDSEVISIKRYLWWGISLRRRFTVFLCFHISVLFLALFFLPYADEFSEYFHNQPFIFQYLLIFIILLSVVIMTSIGITLVTDWIAKRKHLSIFQKPEYLNVIRY